ncbi:acyl-CoA thioesterase [Rheinheimera marina]|uniref:Acyl-CoA thioesterase n=1 Tax=Rheinheimera marina TaxID=1774958 RepID=A0ABV9JS47_9GAMM
MAAIVLCFASLTKLVGRFSPLALLEPASGLWHDSDQVLPDKAELNMPHSTFIKVRGYHLDVYQHVNNARYLEFLEEARWSYLEAVGDIEHFELLGLAWVIVNININYRAQATMGHLLRIDTAFTQINGKSAVIKQKVWLDGTDTLVADADITFVCLDKKAGRAVLIEGPLKERLATRLETL